MIVLLGFKYRGGLGLERFFWARARVLGEVLQKPTHHLKQLLRPFSMHPMPCSFNRFHDGLREEDIDELHVVILYVAAFATTNEQGRAIIFVS